MPGCFVASDKRRSSLLTTKSVFKQKISHTTESRFNQIRCGEKIKYNVAFFAAVMLGRRELTVLKFKYFFSGSEVSVAHSRVTLTPPKFRLILL